MKSLKKNVFITLIFTSVLLFFTQVSAQRTLDLTLDTVIRLTLDQSYAKLHLDLDKKMMDLDYKDLTAYKRGTVATMDLFDPELNYHKSYYNYYNSNDVLKSYELDSYTGLRIIQPVNLLDSQIEIRNYIRTMKMGGKLSHLNNKNYYIYSNVSYTQPLFKKNLRKLNIRSKKLNIEYDDLNFLTDWIGRITDAKYYYYSLLETSLKNDLFDSKLSILNDIEGISETLAQQDPLRNQDTEYIQLEKNNLMGNMSFNKIEVENIEEYLIYSLRLRDIDNLNIEPEIELVRVPIDIEDALEKTVNLNPEIRSKLIQSKIFEVSLNISERHNKPLQIGLQLLYNLSNSESEFDRVFKDQNRSATARITANLYLWDWGTRKISVDKQRVRLENYNLVSEETNDRLRSETAKEINTYQVNQELAFTLQAALESARTNTQNGIERYRNGEINIYDLMQIVNRYYELELLYAETYVMYKNSLSEISFLTFYDYEENISLEEKYNLKRRVIN
ncbi:TolC family protein [candidate division KSB1 bacterium]